MPSTKVEVEYVKGGRRKLMKPVYANVLLKAGIVKNVQPQAEVPKPAAPIIPPKLPEQQPAVTPTSQIPADDDTDTEAEKPAPKKRTRTYKRRDMHAEDGEQD